MRKYSFNGYGILIVLLFVMVKANGQYGNKNMPLKALKGSVKKIEIDKYQNERLLDTIHNTYYDTLIHKETKVVKNFVYSIYCTSEDISNNTNTSIKKHQSWDSIEYNNSYWIYELQIHVKNQILFETLKKYDKLNTEFMVYGNDKIRLKKILDTCSWHEIYEMNEDVVISRECDDEYPGCFKTSQLLYENGLLTEQISFEIDGDHCSYTYNYNENNDLEIVSTNGNNCIPGYLSFFTYLYDEFENWIECREYRDILPSDILNKQILPSKLYKRKIEYK